MAAADRRSGTVAYGKFFDGKAGFISRAWFPHFANWRRDGYDFDSRWDEELATMRQKRIMDQFLTKDEWFSFELKRQAGFGKSGEKNFEGTVTDLQMGGYLLIRDFRRRRNQAGAGVRLAHLCLLHPRGPVGLWPTSPLPTLWIRRSTRL